MAAIQSSLKVNTQPTKGFVHPNEQESKISVEQIVEIITPSLSYKKKRVYKCTNIGTKRWGIKRIVDRVQPTLHKKKKKKRTINDKKQNGEVQIRMHKGRWRTAMGRNLEDAYRGVDDPFGDAHSRNSTMLDRCLLLHDDIPFLSYSNQSRLRTHRTTHTHTAQNHAEKERLPNDPNYPIDRTRRLYA